MEMIIEQVTDLGKDALENPKMYNGFLGTSIPHKFFSKTNMEYYFKWGSKQFKEFLIILMDDPEHYNFMVFKKVNKKKALQHARDVSENIKGGYEKVLENLRITNTKIVRFRDFRNDKKYQSFLSEIKNFYKTNKEFRNDMLSLMENWVGGKIRDYVKSEKPDKNKYNEIIESLSHYIIEELVCIIYFTEIGYQIELDPTPEFMTKKRIYEGDFQELYNKLKLTKRGHLFIHPKGIVK